MKGDIEFNGMITGKAKKFYYKKEAFSRICLIACIWIGCSVIVPIAFALMFGGEIDVDWPGYFLCIFIFLVIFCASALLILFLKTYNLKKISFDCRHLYILKGKKNFTVPVSAVKQIEDHGEFYRIKLHLFSYVGNDFNIFICQKNLLTKGTIENFEKMFDNKIVRSEKHD